MEGFGGFRFSDMSKNVKKKRSNPSRRPREDTPPDNHGNSSLSSSPPTYKGSKESSDDNNGFDNNHCQKEINLNACNTRVSYTDLTEAGRALKVSVDSEKQGIQESKVSEEESRRSSKGAIAPASWKSPSVTRESSGQSEVASDGKANNTVVKRVKLKVGGVVRTIHAKSDSGSVAPVGESSSTKSLRLNAKQISQENSNEDHSPSPDARNGLRGIPWKDFSRSGFSVGKVGSSRGTVVQESLIKNPDKYEPVRKSKRVPKRRLLDGETSDGDDDGEIRYLEKLKTSKFAASNVEYDDEDQPGSRKRRKISRVLSRSVGACYDVNAGSYGSSRSSKESSNKSKLGREYEDSDYVDEEEHLSDGEPVVERKKQKKELSDIAVTTRQRALQTGKDASFGSNVGFIEFPNGLPPAPPRKQKDKLSEVEQQLKKAEAAQRRKIQVEKAARESEAEAIRKILGHDSSRKKRENKIKQRQEEMAQERTATVKLASNTVRWVIGPTGTVVTFPDDMGFPTIFEPKTCSYPPPREKCAGPTCSNPFKYRDSTSKLPLCSLQCYKAVHEKIQPLTAC